MIQYDSKVIFQFADRLYKQAAQVVASYAAVGGLIGLGIGAGAGLMLRAPGGALADGIIVGLFLGAMGYAMGQQKAFELRLQAQQALCQAKIEENTRTRTQAS